MKSLNNTFNQQLFKGSLVYYADKTYQYNMADVLSIGRTNVLLSFTHFKTREKIFKKVNVNNTPLPLIHNANVVGIEYNAETDKYHAVA